MDVTLQNILAQKRPSTTTTRSLIIGAYGTICALVIGITAAGALIPIGTAVIGHGTVAVENHVKRIAHPTGGIIAAIYVRNGDRVARNQPLMRLDDAVSGNEASLDALTLDQMLAQRARLEAEQLGATVVAFPSELSRRTDANARQAMAFEATMFATRQSEQSRMASQLHARSEEYREQIAGLRAQIAAIRRQTTLIEPERQGLQMLFRKGLVTISRLNQVERQAVDYDGQIAALQSQIAEVEAKIGETHEQLLQAKQSHRGEAGTELARLNLALNQQRQRSAIALDTEARTMIRAPYAGVVDKIAFTTVGDVVKPAETIMVVVPDHDRKIVEAKIDPGDIDRLAVGSRARVRFTALDRQTTPESTGTVTTIGADRVVDPDGRTSYYTVTIMLNRDTSSHRDDLSLRSGMSAEVFVESGSRSMLSYLIKPLHDQLVRAFRSDPR